MTWPAYWLLPPLHEYCCWLARLRWLILAVCLAIVGSNLRLRYLLHVCISRQVTSLAITPGYCIIGWLATSSATTPLLTPSIIEYRILRHTIRHHMLILIAAITLRHIRHWL